MREWGQTGFDVECTCNHKIAIQLEWSFHVFSISNIFCRNYSELSLVFNTIFSFYYFASYIWFYDGSPNTLYSPLPWSTFLWSPYASRAYNRGITCFHLFFTYIVDHPTSNIISIKKEMLIMVRDRQACSSHHQIVIWICFWFYICQLNQSTNLWGGNAV